MADADRPFYGEVLFPEYLVNQPDAPPRLEPLSVEYGETRRILPAVLESEQGEEGKSSYIFTRSVNTENATRLVQIRLPLNSA
jgi:hypothetical protein